MVNSETDGVVAKFLKSFFESVFPNESSHSLPGFPGRLSHEATLTDMEFTPKMVMEELKTLSKNKAPGPDGTSPALLSAFAERLAILLHTLYDKSVKMGQLPLDWKKQQLCQHSKKWLRVIPAIIDW